MKSKIQGTTKVCGKPILEYVIDASIGPRSKRMWQSSTVEMRWITSRVRLILLPTARAPYGTGFAVQDSNVDDESTVVILW